ncbi:MAG: VWA domain-containing protein, partial [Pseudomonadota bacterium]
MTRRRSHIAVLAYLLSAPVFAQPVPPASSLLNNNATFKDDVNLVLLDVSVHNNKGGFVSGLEKSNFRVLEDDRPQTITQFANTDMPVTVGLVVDESGSMRQKRPDVIVAALVFIQASNPHDEIFVVNFNDDVTFGLPVSRPFSDNIQQLRAALWMGDPDGRTRLYDAIIAALGHLEKGRCGRKALIVISDGGDNYSKHAFEPTLRDVEESRATIYTVGVFDQTDPDRNPRVLERLSRATGGATYLPKSLAEVPDVCRQIAKDIRTRYTLGYV